MTLHDRQMEKDETDEMVIVSKLLCMTSARSALVKNSLPFSNLYMVYDTKCLQYFISTGMSHNMYVPGRLWPLHILYESDRDPM